MMVRGVWQVYKGDHGVDELAKLAGKACTVHIKFECLKAKKCIFSCSGLSIPMLSSLTTLC